MSTLLGIRRNSSRGTARGHYLRCQLVWLTCNRHAVAKTTLGNWHTAEDHRHRIAQLTLDLPILLYHLCIFSFAS